MSREDRLYVSPANPGRKQRCQMWVGDIRNLTVDWTAVKADRGTTLTGSAWDTDDTGQISTADAAIDGSTTTLEVEAINTGSASLSNTATFADGSTAVCWWIFNIKDES